MASSRDQVGALLRTLRGDTPLAALARRLNIAPAGVRKIEEGRVSLVRLDQLGNVLGVRFEVVAFDAVTGEPVTGTAPALVE